MTSLARRSAAFATLCIAALAVSACSTGSASVATHNIAPEPANPVIDSAVATASLPPIGQDGMVQQGGYGQPMQPGVIGTPVYSQQAMPQQGFPQQGGAPQVYGQQPMGQPGISSLPPLNSAGTTTTYPAMGDPLAPPATGVASADPSFVTLDAVGTMPNTSGRDLSGGLTVAKLLGGWTIVSGADQCRLNLTQTTKSGTSRFRASTPGCTMAGLKVVASWQLAGNQVQLFDENGDIIAQLMLSGNRFIGVLSGGQGISMVG
jgi:hypothetical protein